MQRISERGIITNSATTTNPCLLGDEGNHHDAADRPRKGPASGGLIDGIFLAAALAALLLWAGTPVFRTMEVTFVAIVLEALPFMMVGSIAGGLIEVFISNERLSRIFPKGRKGVLLAAGLGLLFPVCECAVIPLIRRLLTKGVPPGAAVAFLLAGPIVNPIVFLSTGIAYSFHWSFAFLRLGLGYLKSVSVGLIIGAVFGSDPRRIMLYGDAARSCPDASCSCHLDHAHVEPFGDGLFSRRAGRMWEALSHGAGDFLDTGRFLVIGAFVAALINAALPRHVLAGLAGAPILCIGAAMVLAMGLNLCSDADAFVASSMRPFLPYPAQMAFMLLGPMLDIKLLFMYRSLFRKRFIVFMAVVIPACVMLTALGHHALLKVALRVLAGGAHG
ncbi:MAG: permease [Syntrophorhabdales bacterium]|jgi:uncharacterized membrane protein YraQ (UPF0718 family)